MKNLFQILLILTCLQLSGQVIITGGSTIAGNTDQQQLSIDGNTLSLENGGSVNLSGLLSDATPILFYDQTTYNALPQATKDTIVAAIKDWNAVLADSVVVQLYDHGLGPYLFQGEAVGAAIDITFASTAEILSANVQAAIEELRTKSLKKTVLNAQTEIVEINTGGTLKFTANGVDAMTVLGSDNGIVDFPTGVYYNNVISGLTADQYKTAIDEVADNTSREAYHYNSISTSITGANTNVTQTGTANGKKVWNQVTTNDTITLDNSISLIGNPFVIQPWGADSVYIKKDVGINFYIADSSAVLGSDGIIVKQRHPISVLKTAASEYFLQGNFTTHLEGFDPYLALGPVAYFNAKNINQTDGTDVLQWDDLTGNNYHFLDGTDAPIFDNSSGFNQVVFDGIDDLLLMASDHAALDFDTDGSNYTLIFHLGDVPQTVFSGFTFFKGDYNSADRQFSLSTNSSGTNMTLNVGGDTENLSGLRSTIHDDYLVIRREGGNYTLYVNNSAFATDIPGTSGTPSSNPWSIGGRFNNQLQVDCSFRKVVFFDYAVPLAELTTRYNNRNDE